MPNESLKDSELAANDKDLVQRLESTLIHWTRQIKEVVSNLKNHIAYVLVIRSQRTASCDCAL